MYRFKSPRLHSKGNVKTFPFFDFIILNQTLTIGSFLIYVGSNYDN